MARLFKDNIRLGCAAIAALLIAGCATNLKSIPKASSRNIMNEDARTFLAGSGIADLASPSLPPRAAADDGMIATLSISGGGMRAAAYTLGVMSELDRMGRESGTRSAFERIDRVSSVSGGSWARAATLAQKYHRPDDPLADHRDALFGRFAKLDTGLRKCWAARLIADEAGTITGGLTLGEVYAADRDDRLPRVYFNSTLYPGHAPFVFTDGYLARYRVSRFGAPCIDGEPAAAGKGAAGIKLGIAAAASSAVPAFTKVWAETGLCDRRTGYSFCFPNRGPALDHLQLMDGGLYDNIGYKTTLELAAHEEFADRGARRVAIFVDANESPEYHSVSKGARNSSPLIGLALASSFPNQNATFLRLRDKTFAALGYETPILLDFGAAAHFDRARDTVHIADLPELAHFAANFVSCYHDNGTMWNAPKRFKMPELPETPNSVEQSLNDLEKKGRDCLSENFYRTGYLHKTTYEYDEALFRLRYQLGQFVARRHEATIRVQLGLPRAP